VAPHRLFAPGSWLLPVSRTPALALLRPGALCRPPLRFFSFGFVEFATGLRAANYLAALRWARARTRLCGPTFLQGRPSLVLAGVESWLHLVLLPLCAPVPASGGLCSVGAGLISFSAILPALDRAGVAGASRLPRPRYVLWCTLAFTDACPVSANPDLTASLVLRFFPKRVASAELVCFAFCEPG